jgi:hypothetical protein
VPAYVPKECRACKRGDCGDCIRFTFEQAGCEHRCGMLRQLSLFDLTEDQNGALPVRGQRDDSR